MGARVLFGIAGFNYPDWEGIVYPKPKPRGFEPLELIAQLVEVVEINSSFYSPLSSRTTQKWITIVKFFPDFRFTAKLWQKFTHEQTEPTSQEIALWKKGLEPLTEAGKLSCLLIQFPWSFKNHPNNFTRLKKIVEAFKEFKLVIEVRHSSWEKQCFFNWLKEHQIGFANIDQPIFKNSIKPTEIVTSPIAYVRLHGRNKENWFNAEADTPERYNYLYTRQELIFWLNRIKKLSELSEEFLVIFNNHFQGKALANALELKFLWNKQKVKVPKSLLERYPRLREFCLALEGDLFGNKSTLFE